MVTGYEVQMYHDLHQIAVNTGRIADCLEAAEKRTQATTPEDTEREKS
jgi:hypothetical protein